MCWQELTNFNRLRSPLVVIISFSIILSCMLISLLLVTVGIVYIVIGNSTTVLTRRFCSGTCHHQRYLTIAKSFAYSRPRWAVSGFRRSVNWIFALLGCYAA
jgi:hypothetical protein